MLTMMLFLTGCGTDLFGTNNKPTIIEKPVTIEKTIYPQLPKVPYPGDVRLVPFNWDYPRIEELEVINSKKCKSVDKTKRDSSFWKKCGIPKVDLSSNLFMGMSETNYKTFIQNWNKLLGREKQWRSIVDEINRQREEFRNKKK